MTFSCVKDSDIARAAHELAMPTPRLSQTCSCLATLRCLDLHLNLGNVLDDLLHVNLWHLRRHDNSKGWQTDVSCTTAERGTCVEPVHWMI